MPRAPPVAPHKSQLPECPAPRAPGIIRRIGGLSELSRICAQLDIDVAIWRSRCLDHIAFPHVFLDAKYCKVRLASRGGLPCRRDRDRCQRRRQA